MHPKWAVDFVRGALGNEGHKLLSLKAAENAFSNAIKPINEDVVRIIRRRWKGPLVVKGILRGDDCSRVVDLGADAVIVSNHGGRQLDSTVSTIEALPDVVAAAHGRAQVFLDGGVRRGTDVVKALALGATACLVGRPYLYGMAIGGEAGIERVLKIFRNETKNVMGLLGCPTVEDVNRSCVTLPLERWVDA
jgi:isopentenyl diphosphate isomerase/L-lactate dehydrogenase-like FMN-dependent dehydrogenase